MAHIYNHNIRRLRQGDHKLEHSLVYIGPGQSEGQDPVRLKLNYLVKEIQVPTRSTKEALAIKDIPKPASVISVLCMVL